MNAWRIHKAGVDDIDEVIRLRRELMRQFGGLTDANAAAWEEAARRHLLKALPEGRFHVWLAMAGTEAVACSGLVPFERPPAASDLGGLEGYVLNMYTAPAWRGRGLARALLAELMAFAREAGMSKLWLHASEDGRPLYEKVGFAPEPTALEWKPERH
ncbi:GNAT family N-acetyltransferase [Pyxidicoccus fallax]|uniref:GNAT family N-acetyltransferase n=1 Tax=Pyxidicoccus fallax TaxID=394095 RepID=A0A848LD05_9BACT|nr:GNAT family N-acetyltransferase [Pyxidicoccus fallax]NMO16112.1 GNAT family N-acetyltransferase [Pyxidicoccus fallax]NPC80078.1 GNAT family N-acetyltransferase [Pyxidicoccus fallax]